MLPLKLLSFTGKLINNNKQVQLDWQTAEEQNVNMYQAEWSSDSRNWQKIADVPAKNNGNTNSYSCIHSDLAIVNFYRIKMLDIDKKFSYSEVLRSIHPGNFFPLFIQIPQKII